MVRRSFGRLIGFAGFALAAGCTSTPAPAPAPIAPVAQSAPSPRPVAPDGVPETLAVPALAADGRYQTINRDLSPAATIWHVRAALNVAALGCRGPNEAAIVASYNHLLAVHRTALADADAAYQAEFRAADPIDWQSEHDRRLTRVYNFFAQPLATPRFCAEAAAVSREAELVPDFALAPFAKLALIRLEAPFTDTYRAYETYRAQLAAWAAGAPPTAPRLAYAPFEVVLAWSPPLAPQPTRLAALR